MATTWAVQWAQPGILAAVTNPVTRTPIALSPVIEIWNEDSFCEFYDWVCAYCKACWDHPVRLDPRQIDASNWRDGMPAGV